MSQMQGMDVDGGRRLADTFTRSADRLEHIRFQLDIMMCGLGWFGPDSRTVRAEWDGQHRPALDCTADALREACRKLLEQVAEQERASGTADGLLAALGAWFRARGEDIGRAVGSAVDWVGDRIEDGMDWVSDGVDWVTDKVSQGVEWVGGRISDGLGWVGDRGRDVLNFVVPRVQAAIPALDTLGQALGVFGSQFTRIFTEGRIPQAAELMASGLLVGGALLGLGANVATGEDHGFFAPGKPWAGAPTDAVNADKTTGMTSLAANTMTAYGEHDDGKLRVEAVKGADGKTRYIVSIPGTQADLASPGGWSNNDNARNWSSNLWGMAQGSDSTASQAVIMAIRNSVPPGAEILLTGHSQGGLIAANVAADPAFAKEYRVAGVVGFASPMDCADIPRSGPNSVPVLSIQHGGLTTRPGPFGVPVPSFQLGDVVPKLDLGGSYFGPPVLGMPPLIPDVHPHITNVVLPQVGPDASMRPNHAQASYVESMSNLSPENAQTVADFERRNNLSRFYAAPGAEPQVKTVEFGG